MRIAFVDITRWNYDVETPYHIPIGGTQSAVCYLAVELVRLGHEVRLYNFIARSATVRGVLCAPVLSVPAAAWKDLDVVVVVNWAEVGVDIRPLLRPDARLIFWAHHADDQPAMKLFHEQPLRDVHDRFVFVSEWQRSRFEQVYQIGPERSVVLRNAIAPVFEAPDAEAQRRLAQPPLPPVMAYATTPFRGLDVLLAAFPHIREAVPAVTLRVYSSMRVYQVAADADAAQYGALYDRCRSMPGVEYAGSVPQPALAKALAETSILSYPNHFAETSCISVMEAMASGCQIISSALGALPETTAGFATLLPVTGDWADYARQFVSATVAALERSTHDAAGEAQRRAEQVKWINATCTWRLRAMEWQTWLATLR